MPSYQSDFAHRRWNLWGYVDARDVAQAIRLGVAGLLTGARRHRQRSGRHLISATNAKLLANQFPGMPLTREVGEHDTLLAVDKARAMLGCAPVFSSRGIKGEALAGFQVVDPLAVLAVPDSVGRRRWG